MITVANPIYDVVFKYLMEDKRIDTEILHRDYELAKQKVLLDEQKTQLDEQKTQLKKSVQMLRAANLSAETIATSLGMTDEQVKAFFEKEC